MDGKVFNQLNGYLNPEDFRIFMRLSLGALWIPRGRYKETIGLMGDGLSLFPENPRSASMLFTRGMAEYLLKREKILFYETMQKIIVQYPDSPQARMWPYLEQPAI